MSEQRRFSIKDDLGKNVFSGFAKFQIALALMIFLPAWSSHYWQGWVYWLLFGTCCVVVTLCLRSSTNARPSTGCAA